MGAKPLLCYNKICAINERVEMRLQCNTFQRSFKTGCLQNQANKIPGFLQDCQEFFKQFSRISLHKMSTQISSFIL